MLRNINIINIYCTFRTLRNKIGILLENHLIGNELPGSMIPGSALIRLITNPKNKIYFIICESMM